MGEMIVKDPRTQREYTITTAWVPDGYNLCAEVPLAFAGETMFGAYVNNLEGEWNMSKEWLTTEDGDTILVDAVIRYSYELSEWTKELTLADVWNISMSLVLSDGSEHLITDVNEMVKFLRYANDGGGGAFSSHDGKPGSFEYYVKNLWRHLGMVDKAEQLNG